MGALDHRIQLATDWLAANVAADAGDRAGWGWVPDVAPNPQNTAEVVCALTHVGRPIPRRGDALELVRSDVVKHHEGGDWAFRALVDVAWRLRALRCLVADPEDADVIACAQSLIAAQESETGGWRFAGRAGPVSVTATAAALLALAGLETRIDTVPAVRAGIRFLIEALLSGDERARPLFAAAQIASVLARPEIVAVGGPRNDRARKRAADIVLEHLDQRRTAIEEEVFNRDRLVDTWRHLTLHMSLGAIASASPERVFEPGFRAGLVALLDLQETSDANVNRGGFRTSAEGFVTSYATTQALEVLGTLDAAVSTKVNPARTFELLSRVDGAHHSDPQEIIGFCRIVVRMNSHAGFVFMLATGVSGATVVALSLAFADSLGRGGSRALIVWGSGFIAFGVFGYWSARLPAVSNRTIAVLVFTAFTALVLPIVTFLLS